MKKQLIIIGIFTVIITVGLSGCDDINKNINPEKSKFVGAWQNATNNITRTFILYSNDSCSLSTLNETGTWDVKDSKFVMEFPDRQITYTFYYSFSNNNRSLSLTSAAVQTSTTTVFTRQ